MPYLPGFSPWIAHHRALMTLFEITGYRIIWATVVAFLVRLGRWTLLFLTQEADEQFPGVVSPVDQVMPGRSTDASMISIP